MFYILYLTGFFTNHSLRSTCATRLYAAGVDEQLVMERTGHQLNAVRQYKRTCDDQITVSDIVQNQKTSMPIPEQNVMCNLSVPNITINARGNVTFKM